MYVNSETERAAGRYVDAFEFVRLGKSVDGLAPLAWFERVIEDLPEQDPSAMVTWSAVADRGPADEPLIHVAVHALVNVQCERCLSVMSIELQSQASLQLVRSEQELDDPDTFDFSELDAISAGTSFDKVLGTSKFDLLEQVEDELVLCLPYVPKHEVCPPSATLTSLAQAEVVEEPVEKRPSPFAVLAGLKTDGKKE